ncbi:hypothetical protein N7493_000814 [Penicillium malachiteum]|uniref:EML-like second beta-propeller domain-containing protein n=1 Tax=Penicillium malachiteum TaxID=1324776 RepID=A0AAD6HXW9_9EURO|nr:hypothetical protein N7493_000814 [Penicillium malachiteum]
MSKQYILLGSAINAHSADIFSLAVTNKHLLSASGSPALKVHAIQDTEFPLVQSIDGAHPLGCHHVVTDGSGTRAVSAGFAGDLKVWSCVDGHWSADKAATANLASARVWAIALSYDGMYLAGVSSNGNIGVWDLDSGEQIRNHETKNSFGTCIDLSPDGRLIASGHENGSVYVFSTESGRMPYSVTGLVKPVRAVAFSPGSRILAAAGNSKVILLYDTASGEQIGTLSGHEAWVVSLSWSFTGEYLLSSSFDGKVKVWNIETKACVSTQAQNDQVVWSTKWFVKSVNGKSDAFAMAGADKNILFYREASG